MSISDPLHPAADRDLAADGRRSSWSARSPIRCCRSRRCRRSIFRPSRSRRKLPGADPVTMASSVTAPLERQFAQIPGVTQMTSSSVLGVSSITVQFDLGRNIDGAAGDIQAAINAAGGQLPKNLPSPPNYRKVNPGDSPILIFAVHSDSLPLDHGRRLCRKRAGAESQPDFTGVAQVNVGGQQKPAVRIQVDPAKLASMGLGLEDLRSVIANVTTDSPKGSIDGATRTFTIYDNDQLLTADAVERRHHRLQERRAGAHARHRPRGRRAGEHQARRLGRRQACRAPGRS